MKSSLTQPYLSIVATSRNDDHGGGMLRRMQIFIRGLDQQVMRHSLNAELVLVEWNPPLDKPLLHEVLPSPSLGSPLAIRYIIVPNEVHRRWRNWTAIPIFQMIAKNVGIRRSKGDFVLCTNVDLLFSDRLCEYLARRELNPLKMYRANRCDVPEDVPENASIEDQLSYCQMNTIRCFGHAQGRTVHGWQNRMIRGLKRMFRRPVTWLPQVDTDACGDFTLLSLKAWEEIRGYPELGMYSIYIDGIGVHAAASAGYEQVILPPDHCTFHAEHHAGWATMTITEKIKLMQVRPFLDYATYEEAVRWMWAHRQPLPINDENWGCRQDHLQEVCIRAQIPEGGQTNA